MTLFRWHLQVHSDNNTVGGCLKITQSNSTSAAQTVGRKNPDCLYGPSSRDEQLRPHRKAVIGTYCIPPDANGKQNAAPNMSYKYLQGMCHVRNSICMDSEKHILGSPRLRPAWCRLWIWRNRQGSGAAGVLVIP